MANMGVVSAFLVVILHVGEPKIVGSSGWWWSEICMLISKIAVPYFFVAAGFFLAGHINEKGWWPKEVLKRIKTLLIPYIIWCLIWWLFYAPFGLYADYLHSREFGYSISLFDSKWLNILGLNIFQCPFYSPMWFLRALFIIILGSVLLVPVIRRWGVVVLAMLFVSYVLITPDATHKNEWSWMLRHGVSLFGTFWFSVGIFLRMRMDDIKVWLNKPGAIIAMFLSICILGANTYFDFCGVRVSFPLEPFFIGLCLYWVFCFISSGEWADYLTRNTFPIYLLHSFFTFTLGITFFRNTDLWWHLSFKALVSFLLSVLVSVLMRRYMHSVSKILLGSR